MKRNCQVAACIIFLLVVALACAPPPDEAPRDLHAEVAALADEVWQWQLAQDSYFQVRQGQLFRELPDLTRAQAAEEIAFWRSMLDKVRALPSVELDHEDALTVAILRWDAELIIEGEPYYWLRFPYTPYMVGFLFNFTHQQLAAHPFSEPAVHTENYLAALGEYAALLEQLQAHIEGQVERGIYLSRHALPGVLDLYRSYRTQAETLMPVTDERLAAFEDEEREAFKASVAETLATRVMPAFEGLLGVLGSETYAANAPNAVGLSQYPDGEAYYRFLVKAHTTMDTSPEALHELGKQRVAELEAKMAAIRSKLGFEGSRDDFHQKLRTDPQFFAQTPAEVEAIFEDYIARIEPLLGDYFWHQPQASYGVARLSPAAEGSMTFGFYSPPTPDKPTGLYYYNGSKLDQRPQIWAGPLIYHELIPGHHFQIALQNENESLPHYRQEYFNAGAFAEGWGNYAAYLAEEIGMLPDPHEQYGAALFDMFSSARLVLDTGMNLMGWSLEEGRAYMAEHTFQSPTEIATETLRYATDLNAQALNYKGGLEKFLALRAKAEAQAGDAWDIRDFHDAVLGSGAMPMAVLEDHLAWYFEQKKAQGP